MRIAVCIKQVPDTETKIKLKADRSGIEATGVKWIISPYDEHAVEEALKIRDANPGSSVFVYSFGPKTRVVEAVRTALAMGADEGVLIDGPEFSDGSLSATALAKALKKDGPYDLVLTGKLAIDDNASSVTQMLSQELGWPHVNVVSKLVVTSSQLTAEREVEGGTREIFEIALPAVVGANKGLNMPRYASLPGIMKAKKKVIKEYDLASLEVSLNEERIEYSDFQLPPEKPAAQILQGDIASQVASLVKKLREDSKVI